MVDDDTLAGYFWLAMITIAIIVWLYDIFPTITMIFITCGVFGVLLFTSFKIGHKKGIEQANHIAQVKHDYFIRHEKEKLSNEIWRKALDGVHSYGLKVYKEKFAVINNIINETCKANPNNAYLATVLSDASIVLLEEELDSLINRARPAISTAEYIRKKFNERARQWQFEARKYKYQTLLYESMYPSLSKFVQEDQPLESLSKPIDWIPEKEYKKLSEEQKIGLMQNYLDKYISGKKSKWEVGRDYELYVGYLFRKQGWKVIQNGVTAKLNDLGRDLICHKDGYTLIIQCKFWSQSKEIHEKHIAQLLGTSLSYAVENNMDCYTLGEIGNSTTRIVPMLITSTKLSQTAQQFARMLKVTVRQIPFDPNETQFPRIKCNIGKEGKIFHLPFDQLYDRVVISEPDELYASTVTEAVSKGFRRAHRWSGNSESSSNFV